MDYWDRNIAIFNLLDICLYFFAVLLLCDLAFITAHAFGLAMSL